jgi:hypothetical protein
MLHSMPNNGQFYGEIGMDQNVAEGNDITPLYLRITILETCGNRAAASPITISF